MQLSLLHVAVHHLSYDSVNLLVFLAETEKSQAQVFRVRKRDFISQCILELCLMKYFCFLILSSPSNTGDVP